MSNNKNCINFFKLMQNAPIYFTQCFTIVSPRAPKPWRRYSINNAYKPFSSNPALSALAHRSFSEGELSN